MCVFCMITRTAVCYLKIVSCASSHAYVLVSGGTSLLLPKLQEDVGPLSRDQNKMGLNLGATVGFPCVSPKCCSLGTRLQSTETSRWMLLGRVGALRPCPQHAGRLGFVVGGHRPYFYTQVCIPNAVPETYFFSLMFILENQKMQINKTKNYMFHP